MSACKYIVFYFSSLKFSQWICLSLSLLLCVCVCRSVASFCHVSCAYRGATLLDYIGVVCKHTLQERSLQSFGCETLSSSLDFSQDDTMFTYTYSII